jgi:phosphoglycolate phosphatase-like HAD superfamily hydrolase
LADPPRLVLDLDGTLIDAERRQCGLAGAAVRAAGFEQGFDARRFWSLKREGANTRRAFSQMGIGPPVREAAADYWDRHVEAPDWLAKDRLLPEAEEALCWLREHGVRASILTARRCEDRVRAQVERLGLRRRCEELIVVPLDAAARRKAEALSRLKPLGFVGDSEIDGGAAKEAGVPFLAVSTGQRSENFLRALGFECVDSLLEACRRLVGSER